ncbi:MAG: ribonuclease HI [Elusimicrobiota bacterium]
MIRVFTDGACAGNPGRGGWAAILLLPDGKVFELGGAVPRTTNNRMEMLAAVEALRALEAHPGALRVTTDSTYLVKGVTSWVASWKRKGWKRIDGGDVLNRDLWESLDALCAARRVEWEHVRGHDGHPANERCDRIAVAFAQGREIDLYAGPLSDYPVDLLAAPAPHEPRAPRKRAKKGPGTYLSLLDGRLERHATWAECQARVHGKPAKFKKVCSPDEEAATLKDWGI